MGIFVIILCVGAIVQAVFEGHFGILGGILVLILTASFLLTANTKVLSFIGKLLIFPLYLIYWYAKFIITRRKRRRESTPVVFWW